MRFGRRFGDGCQVLHDACRSGEPGNVETGRERLGFADGLGRPGWARQDNGVSRHRDPDRVSAGRTRRGAGVQRIRPWRLQGDHGRRVATLQHHVHAVAVGGHGRRHGAARACVSRRRPRQGAGGELKAG